MARTDNKSNEREVTDVSMTKISAVMRPAQKDATARLLKTAANGGDNNKEDNMSNEKDFAAVAKKAVDGLKKELGDQYDLVAATVQTALEKQSESHDKALAAMGEKVADLEKMAGMSDYERAYMDKMDDKAKKAFMSMSPEDRKKKMDDMKKSDETIEVDGQILHKSEATPAEWAMANRLWKMERTQAEHLAKAERVELMRKAEKEIPHIPGKVEDKADMLKSIGDNEAVMNIMKAYSEYLGKSKKELGTAEAPELGANDELHKMVKAHALKKSISEAEAEVELMDTDEYKKLYSQTV